MGKIANSLGIRYVTGGPPQLRSTLNQIIAGMDRLMVRRSVDIDAVDNANGTLLTIRDRSSGAGRSRVAPRTLFVFDASTISPAAAKISVTFGQVNGITPTLGGLPISAVPSPDLAVTTGVIYLHATVMSGTGVITALAIETGASIPVNTETDAYQSLALVTVASGVVSLIQPSAWNISALQRCGSEWVDEVTEIPVYLWGGFGA